jgi:hypothetical protein
MDLYRLVVQRFDESGNHPGLGTQVAEVTGSPLSIAYILVFEELEPITRRPPLVEAFVLDQAKEGITQWRNEQDAESKPQHDAELLNTDRPGHECPSLSSNSISPASKCQYRQCCACLQA